MAIEMRYDTGAGLQGAYQAGLVEAMQRNAQIVAQQQAAVADQMRAMAANSAAQQQAATAQDQQQTHANIAGAEIGARFDLQAMNLDAQAQRDQFGVQAQTERDTRLAQTSDQHLRLQAGLQSQQQDRAFAEHRQMRLLEQGAPLSPGEQRRMETLQGGMDQLLEQIANGDMNEREAAPLLAQIDRELGFLQARENAATRRNEADARDVRRRTFEERNVMMPMYGPDGRQIFNPDGTPQMVPRFLDDHGIPRPIGNHISPLEQAEIDSRNAATRFHLAQAAQLEGGRSPLTRADIQDIEHRTMGELEHARGRLTDLQHAPMTIRNLAIADRPKSQEWQDYMQSVNYGLPRWASPFTRQTAQQAETATDAGARRIFQLNVNNLLAQDRENEVQNRIRERQGNIPVRGQSQQGPARGPRGQELLQEDTGGGGAGRPQLQEDVPQNPLARQPQVDAVQQLAESLRRTGGPIIMPAGAAAPEDLPGPPLAGGLADRNLPGESYRQANETTPVFERRIALDFMVSEGINPSGHASFGQFLPLPRRRFQTRIEAEAAFNALPVPHQRQIINSARSWLGR